LKTIEIPGKLFLTGEYSVIRGGYALLAPLKPAYSYGRGPEASPHPESPCGRFLAEFNLSSDRGGIFETGGPGPGFGSSTAELIAASRIFGTDAWEPAELLEWYQSRFPDASGADLLVQAVAARDSGVLYSFSGRGDVETLRPGPGILRRILLFKTSSSNKLPTHLDLQRRRPELDPGVLDPLCRGVARALQGGFEEGFLNLNEFARRLSEAGYETSYAREIRESLLKQAGVWAVKGCGAGLHDAFLVILRSDADSGLSAQITRHAESLGIIPIGELQERLW
jgi:hypothetical protein